MGQVGLRQEKSAYRRRGFNIGVVLFLLGFSLAGLGRVAAQEPTAARIEHADKEPQNWLTFFGNYRAWSYSSLNQINRENVKQLVPAWVFPTGGHGGVEAAPLVMDGVLYAENEQNEVFALDAATGKMLWAYTYPLPKGLPPYRRRARGMAMGYGMIYLGTTDNHVIALDQKTGKEVWRVEVEDVLKCSCRVTSAPLVVKDKVIAGIAGDALHRGYLTAYDAKSGALAWRSYTIPGPGEPGNDTWPGDSWKTGGGTTWYTGSYDPELNLIYWGVGNPSSDYYGEERQGDNLYTDSLIALDADTGKLKWYFQETPHDLYDYDSNAEPVLIDVDKNGQKQKLLLHSTKNGFAYLINRENGKLIRTFPYVDNVTWTKGLDKNGRPIDPVVPKQGNDYLFCPGTQGGRNRNHSAYSPRTGWWYVSSFELCAQLIPMKENPNGPPRPTGGEERGVLSPTSVPHITAFDPLTGEKQWTFNTTYFNVSSLMATAGDLIFGGDVEGYAFALDAKTGKKVWSFNTGGIIASAPVSYSVNGKQYIALGSGGGSAAELLIPGLYPETKDHLPRDSSTLFVFALPENK